jgi:lysozyme
MSGLQAIALGVAAIVAARYLAKPAPEPDAAATDDTTDDTTDDEPTALEELSAGASEAMNKILGYAAAGLEVSAAGEQQIKSHEACKLQRYRLGDGGYTLGWGRYYKDGGPVPPESITQATADQWFSEDIESRAAKWVRAYVTVNVTQSQFDALASLAYNLSPKSFRTIADAVNAGQDPEQKMLQFVLPGSKLERGLRNRRAQEIALYRSEGIAA